MKFPHNITKKLLLCIKTIINLIVELKLATVKGWFITI